MKRAILFGTLLAVLFCLSGLPLMAQGRGAGSGGGVGQGQAAGPPPSMEQRGLNNGIDMRTNGPMVHQKTASEMLAQNAKLSEKLQPLLPADQKIRDAVSGFKDLGEFVAAVHVAHNLNIPFDQLKGKMTSGDSLGKALQTLNPNLSHKQVKSEVKKGKQQAKEDIKASHHS
jgi:hypothetical protein